MNCTARLPSHNEYQEGVSPCSHGSNTLYCYKGPLFVCSVGSMRLPHSSVFTQSYPHLAAVFELQLLRQQWQQQGSDISLSQHNLQKIDGVAPNPKGKRASLTGLTPPKEKFQLAATSHLKLA